jgi:hypothetical protein
MTIKSQLKTALISKGIDAESATVKDWSDAVGTVVQSFR